MMSRLSTVLAILAVLLAALGGPRPGAAQSAPVVLPGFPTLQQQHFLTCEASAASMGAHGVLSESQLMAVMPRNPNPNLGFRGNPDGKQIATLTDYGVYAAPLHRALLRYGYHSDVLLYASRQDIIASINHGRPLVAWITYKLQRAIPRLAQSNGIQFFLVPHEHAVLLIGYDANTVIGNDPWTGKQVRYFWRDFERSWGLFADMALSMWPCPAADPVDSIQVARQNAARLTWTWSPARNAAQYYVKVIEQGASNPVLFQGLRTDQRFIVSNPDPGATYQIAVTSVSACGERAAPTSLAVTLPQTLPGASPTPPERPVTPVTTPNPTASPTASATPAPTPAPTSSRQ